MIVGLCQRDFGKYDCGRDGGRERGGAGVAACVDVFGVIDKDFNDKQICNKCGDIKGYHTINLCYNYEPKFNKVKKQKPISWSNYFKSYFVEIKPEIDITYEPVYSEKCDPGPSDSGKAYCSSNLSDYIGGISPNYPFKKSNLPETGCTNTSPPIIIQRFNWSYLDKLEYRLEYILNGMWIDIYKQIVVFLTPVKYITESEMVQMKNEIKQVKNEMKNMKIQMLSDLKHKIDNNYKFIINADIKAIWKQSNHIKNKLENTEFNLEKLNLINHKQESKLLMEDINRFDKEKLKIQDDYEKIEA